MMSAYVGLAAVLSNYLKQTLLALRRLLETLLYKFHNT